MTARFATTVSVFMKQSKWKYRGIFAYYKEKNTYSEDVLDWIKLEVQSHLQCTLFGLQIRSGFSNLIDPWSSGVMIYAMGDLNKYLKYSNFLDSDHFLKIKLGEDKATGASDATVIKTKPYDHVSKQMIDSFCQTFTGDMTLPKIRHFYRPNPVIDNSVFEEEDPLAMSRKLFRETHIGFKIVPITQVRLINFDPPYLMFYVNAMSSFQPAALAYTLAQQFDTCAHLVDCVRTSLGPFHVNDCIRKHQLHESEIFAAFSRHTGRYVKAVKPHLDKLRLYDERRLFNK